MMRPQTLSILDALLQDPAEWRYGYDLSQICGLKSGTLYPILIRLAERGWLESEWRQKAGEKPRHMYKLTSHGRQAAKLALTEARLVSRSLKPVKAER